jgi:hypothetical protein
LKARRARSLTLADPEFVAEFRARLRMFISMNSSRLMPPSPSLSFRAMVRSIHSRSEK